MSKEDDQQAIQQCDRRHEWDDNPPQHQPGTCDALALEGNKLLAHSSVLDDNARRRSSRQHMSLQAFGW